MLYQVGLLVGTSREAAQAVLRTSADVVVRSGSALAVTLEAAGEAATQLFPLFLNLLANGAIFLDGKTRLA